MKNNPNVDVKDLFPNLYQYFKSEWEGKVSPDSFHLLLQKGFYPYEYVNSMEKYDEVKLPSKDSFKSFLNFSSISDEDYAHAQNVYKTFHMKNFGDYTKLYVVCDTLLLADVIFNFRKLCYDTYELDPVGRLLFNLIL